MILITGLGLVFALLGIACVFVGEWRTALGFGLMWLFSMLVAKEME